MAMEESGDCLTRCSAVLSNLPGSILQGGGLDVRNEGSVARKLSCDGDAWRGLCCARGRPGKVAVWGRHHERTHRECEV
jgi:hypothetical protein